MNGWGAGLRTNVQLKIKVHLSTHPPPVQREGERKTDTYDNFAPHPMEKSAQSGADGAAVGPDDAQAGNRRSIGPRWVAASPRGRTRSGKVPDGTGHVP
ncbi:hypothetical protein GCM10009765_82690 [Fodinicola feengrottensis]|uniref:Uncharacterized protein n=1 Tax=Fodinicola feengrottensis TaxID=435914 RepID=A0ABN2JBX9_9ACTN